MLVGGEPINADPPLRFMELNYCFQTANALANKALDLNNMEAEKKRGDGTSCFDLFAVVSTNSRDFGPLAQKSSIPKVSSISRQLYCEHFVHSSIKWNICPKDLKLIVKEFEAHKMDTKDMQSYDDLVKRVSSVTFDNLQSVEMKFERKASDPQIVLNSFDKGRLASNRRNVYPENQNGAGTSKEELSRDDLFSLGGELRFTLGISRNEIQYNDDEEGCTKAVSRVFAKGIANAIRADSIGFEVEVKKLSLNEEDGGATEFNVEFSMFPPKNMEYGEIEGAAKAINAALSRAMNDGDMASSIGLAAKYETAWDDILRDRIVEEFFFEADITDDVGEQEEATISITDDTLDDEDDFESQRESKKEDLPKSRKRSLQIGEEFNGPFGMPGDTIHAKDDIFLGGGNSGVFPDYSEGGIHSAPFGGYLGPILLDAAQQRAIQRQPRVIAIGDVHGCIDELQSLLRRCDYRPGDLIVFLGDLVSKGPDSLSVVQMSRELGAIGVRGNHDFEVIRWHQAIKSGADPPVIGSEHYQIASSLSTADLRWMYSFPWYLSSKELNALFVHAGFVSGIRLGKQNPRLMMNMRSILPDGTVTSKFFNNWPWARLWDGPQTVLFGHDADRGLQQYEHAIGLDTGCVYGGRLTACILPEKRLVSVNAKREYFQYRRKHFD